MATKLLLFVLSLCIFTWTNASVSVHNPFYCFGNDPVQPHSQMFDIYTAYESVRARTLDPNVSSCAPSKFWLYARHGTRLPTSAEISDILDLSEWIQRDILANYDAGLTTLCEADIELIRNWEFDAEVTAGHDEDLTVSGWFELHDLAQRLQAAYPTLFPSTYSPDHYYFLSSDTPRARDSNRGFADGLFGTDAWETVEFDDPFVPDLIIRPFDHCPLQTEVSSNQIERSAFRDGPEFQQMLTQVSAKLGFHGHRQLRFSDINTIMKLCKFEQAWDLNATAPFCSVFSYANFQTYEYYEELNWYYQYGYGQPAFRTLFENFNCFLLQDMLRFLQSTDPNDHTVRVFNGHFQTIQTMLVAFGVFEDEIRLTRHNFAQQVFRLWNSAHKSPMGGNLAVIRYE